MNITLFLSIGGIYLKKPVNYYIKKNNNDIYKLLTLPNLKPYPKLVNNFIFKLFYIQKRKDLY